MRKIIRKAGHSKQISIPSEICENLKLVVGAVIDIEQVGNQIIITPLQVV